jgi:hypothetical protein
MLSQKPTDACILDIFNRLGPTPRLCFDILSRPRCIVQYEKRLNGVISELTADRLWKLINDARDLSMDAVSHKVCLIRREEVDPFSPWVVHPTSDWILWRLANQFRNIERTEQIRLYEKFSRVPDSRRMAGVIFEAEPNRSAYMRNSRECLIPGGWLG